jgi:membrane protease YdiL (CAAX protease family)
MLLLEKWVSLAVYPRVFGWIASEGTPPRLLDAMFRAFAGCALIALCLVLGRFSRPTLRKTWRRARPIRWPIAALGTLLVLFGCYVVLGGLGAALGGGLVLAWPHGGPILVWIVAGQAVLAFAEELYYRGLLLCEMERLAPRLGLRSRPLRRWTALLFTASLFGMEHFTLGPPWGDALRELVFAVSLGLLLGILVMLSTNLHFAGGVHAWINWLLLGVAPYFVDAQDRPALPAGTYIGLTLILAFVVTYAFRRWRRRTSLDGGPARVAES